MAVTLREKKLTNGQVSLYLDICHNKKRWTEFLNIRINKKRPAPEDTQKRKLALEIKAKREHDLIVADNGLIDKNGKRQEFLNFFEDYINKKPHNYNRTATVYQLRRFIGNKSTSIASITTEWMKEFEHFLLKTVSTNTALSYLENINGALNVLVRKQIIPRNPWHAVPQHDRLKKKDTIRTAWTIDQLSLLANTPCNIEPQYKQAFFFACFTGLRWSDVNGLQWSSIIRRKNNEQEEWFIYFEQQKTESVEYFPLSEQAIKILKEREAENGIYVFPKVKETNPKTFLVHGRVDYALKKWAKAAKLDWKKMRFHTGRHSYATNVLESTGGDLYTVSKLLGHKSVQTTQIYAQVRDKMKQAAVKSLPKLNMQTGGLTSSQNSASTSI